MKSDFPSIVGFGPVAGWVTALGMYVWVVVDFEDVLCFVYFTYCCITYLEGYVYSVYVCNIVFNFVRRVDPRWGSVSWLCNGLSVLFGVIVEFIGNDGWGGSWDRVCPVRM